MPTTFLLLRQHLSRARALSSAALVALCWMGAPALAQEAPAAQGLEVEVTGDRLVQFILAVPDAASLGGEADTKGVREALSGTIQRALSLTGYFNLLDSAAFLADPAKEGMDPDLQAWFNSGTQGLVKAGFRIEGQQVHVDLRLYSVDGGQRVNLPAPYNAPMSVPLDSGRLRRHAHGFVNEVIRYYTKEPGFFDTRIIAVRRNGRDKELVLISPDGLEETQLTRSGGINMLPSMGGGSIYFTSFRSGAPHIYKLVAGKTVPFASYEGLNTGAVPSPGGGTVAATLSKDGNAEIYLLDAASGNIKRRLTNAWGIDTSPAWSPDGSQIAFVSDRHGSPQIWVMGADGSNARRVTFQGDYNQTPDWSPKGDKIAFTARDDRAVFDLFTVEVATGAITRLTQNQGNNEEPTWSPDGRFIMFTSTRSGSSQLYLMTADGRVQTQISGGKGEYFTPYWARK